MSTSSGASIPTNSLVFDMDSLNIKSWKGRPITNSFLVPTPDSSGNVTFSVNGTGTFQRVYYGTYGGYSITSDDVVYRYNLGSTGCHYHGNDTSVTVGQLAIFTFEYYIDQSCGSLLTNHLASFEGAISTGGGDPTPTSLGVWKTYSTTGTTGTTNLRTLLYPGGCGDRLASTGFILYKNPRMYVGINYDVPFVSGTRSNAQSILDLTKNVNYITANSLTYLTNNTFSFDAVGDYIDLNTNFPTMTGDISYTLAAWVKINSNRPAGGVITGSSCIVGHNDALGFGIQIDSGNYVNFGLRSTGNYDGATALALNTWYHVVGVKVALGYSYIYINGVLDASHATSPGSVLSTTTTVRIGYGPGRNNIPFDGYISSVQIYNKALSSDEVRQLFNAQRSKFGI